MAGAGIGAREGLTARGVNPQREIESGPVLFEAMVKLSASLMLRYKVNQALSDFERAVM